MFFVFLSPDSKKRTVHSLFRMRSFTLDLVVALGRIPGAFSNFTHHVDFQYVLISLLFNTFFVKTV